ncbi:hypothetical protein HDA40_002167 [Hamadaea flava]|uniref:DUF3592 domain-containing protein n=1 Tax=Hamadaea flava TaxID=1742688 RepID=A0ABV8LLP0_9ACTN|nr:hypothetical protein [Hamadaea flava]MCP2323660.1 hypothetical protein [Hamadaea flava]
MAEHAPWRAVVGAVGSHYPITRRRWWTRFAMLGLTFALVRLTMIVVQGAVGVDLATGTGYQGHGERVLIHSGTDTTCRNSAQAWRVDNAEAGRTVEFFGELRCDQPVTVFTGAARTLYAALWSWWTWVTVAACLVTAWLWRDRSAMPASAFSGTSASQRPRRLRRA